MSSREMSYVDTCERKHRGSHMSAHVLLNLLNKLGEK